MKMKNWFSIILVALFLAIAGLPATAPAATKNFSEAIQSIQVVPFQLTGNLTTTTANIVRFQIPFKAEVLGVSATARASAGTAPTLTIDVKEAGVTILSTPMSITAGTVTEGPIADNMLADEAIITVDIAIGGTSPIWGDITLILTLRRTN
ncbi:hypothetical protein EPN18_07400 [bacterium]|nr:MAG: hypothetical protein EPN18_07400 [bacterium]